MNDLEEESRVCGLPSTFASEREWVADAAREVVRVQCGGS